MLTRKRLQIRIHRPNTRPQIIRNAPSSKPLLHLLPVHLTLLKFRRGDETVDHDDGIRALTTDFFHDAEDSEEGDFFGAFAAGEVGDADEEPPDFGVEGGHFAVEES